MSLEQLLGTRSDWWFKVTTKKRESTIRKHLHMLQGLKLSASWWLAFLNGYLKEEVYVS